MVHAFKPEPQPWDPEQRASIRTLGSIARSRMASALRKRSRERAEGRILYLKGE
jgi:hypothetical protein